RGGGLRPSEPPPSSRYNRVPMRPAGGMTGSSSLSLGLLLGVLLSGPAAVRAAEKPRPVPPPTRIETLGRILALEDSRSVGEGELDRLLRATDRGIRRRAALA